MSVVVKLIDAPEKLIPQDWQLEYKLKLLEINGKNPALTGLIDIASKDIGDLKKLLRNVEMQLKSKAILPNKKKIERGKQKNQKKIIEIKATGGHSRLFAFLSENKELIICTHTYWKTSSNKKQQNREFNKAAEMHKKYLRYYKGQI